MKTIVCGRWNRHSSGRVEAKNLWSVRNKFDARKVEHPELAEAEGELTKALIAELEACGVDYLGDGGFRWDSIFDITRVLVGAEGFSQLTRIPETNHFHRQWGQEPGDCIFVKGCQAALIYFRRASELTNKPIIPCLPGPYSLARQTQNLEAYGNEALVLIYADALNEAIDTLLRCGAPLVRIEDPQILSHPEDWKIFKKASVRLTRGLDTSKLILATWYGDVSKLPGYFKLPFGSFWLDFVEGEANIELLKRFPRDKKLVAGLFDARQTCEEISSEVAEKISRILKFVSEDRICLSTNTDLHFLPWDEALLKVKNMVAFSRAWKNRQVFAAETSVSLPKPPQLGSALLSIETQPSFALARQLFGDLPYPTSSVGSFPQPSELRRARARLREGVLEPEVYGDVVRKYIRAAMELQNDLDTTLPVTGEYAREDMAAVFGVRFGGRLLDFVPSYENRRYRPVEYYRTVRRKGSVARDDFLFAQSLTERPVKETVTGPATLADWALIRDLWYYRDLRSFRMDLARVLREEIDELVASGVRVLQIDEPALTARMRYFPWDIEAIYETIRGLEDKVYLILHLCYSDLEAYDKAFPYILQLPFHQIHMEMANRNYALMRCVNKYGFAGKDIGLGVLDVHTDRIETAEEVVRGVKMARKYFEPHKIWLTPDCGLKERSEEVSRAKLRVMAEAARICRSTLP